MAKCSVWTIVMHGEETVLGSGKMLMLKRSEKANNAGQWNLPGGGVDISKESWRYAASRELQEEAGINFKPIDLRFIGSHLSNVYFGIVAYGDLDVKINEESSEYAWMGIDEIAALTVQNQLHSKSEWFFKSMLLLELGDYYRKVA